MSNQRIVYTREDGGVSVIVPSPEALQTMTIEQIAAKDVPQGLSYRITDVENIPPDRTFREAWTDENPTDTVDIDMTKARDIHKNTLRELRKPLLEALDIEYFKALEAGDEAKCSEIKADKQALRDVTSHSSISNAQTPEDLKNAIPEILQD